MTHLDYGIVALIVLGVLYGLGRGALRIATSLLSAGLGLAAATAWYGRLAGVIEQWLKIGLAAGAVIGFLVLFFAVAAAVEFAGRRIVRLAHVINLNWIDRLGGALFGAALAAAFAGVDVLVLGRLLPPDSSVLHDSVLAPHLLAYNQTLLRYVPSEVKDACARKRDELLRYWSDTAQNPGAAQKPAPAPQEAPRGS